jgi:hypothetical protein
MKENFSKKFNDINFLFKRNYHKKTELWYYINFNNNGKETTLKMYKDKEGMWQIAAQILPEWVMELQIEFNEAIIKNENNKETK